MAPLALVLLAALAGSACGKYGPPSRYPPPDEQAAAAPQPAGADSEEDEDEEKEEEK
jgi:predicted small lipoprotein YifL